MAVHEKVASAGGVSIETISGQPIEAGSAMNARTFPYSPWRFFQVMFAVAWSAFAHPFSTTIIDLETGRVCDAN